MYLESQPFSPTPWPLPEPVLVLMVLLLDRVFEEKGSLPSGGMHLHT